MVHKSCAVSHVFSLSQSFRALSCEQPIDGGDKIMEIPYKLEVFWCRTFQSILKIANYFMGYRMPEYMEGPGKIELNQ